MRTIESRSAVAISTRVWRDLARLGAEALAIGLVFSILLALAVYIVAKNDHGANFAAADTPVTVAAAPR